MRDYYPYIYLPTYSQKGRQAEIHVRREKDSTHALIDRQTDWQRDRQWNRQSKYILSRFRVVSFSNLTIQLILSYLAFASNIY